MIPAWWVGAVLLLLVVDVTLIVQAIVKGHGVEGTLAWIFAILALPGVGALAYVTLSSPSVRRITKRKRSHTGTVRACCSTQLTPFCRDDLCVSRHVDHRMLNLAVNLTGLAPSSGNAMRLLHRNAEAFREIEEALRGAKQRIWTEYYIIENDETGHQFLDILVEKAAEGIEVRLLYDAVGSFGIDRRRVRDIVAHGGRAEAFLPVNPLARRWSVHLRNHRKMIVVDGTIGFTGGMNIGDEYSGRQWRKGGQRFHDTHMRMQGPAVGDLSLTFVEDWHFATGEVLLLPDRPAPVTGHEAVVAVVPSGPDVHPNPNALMYFAAIASSDDRVFLTSPYFIPCEATLRALTSAAMRGVDVRLLVPANVDVKIVGLAARSYFQSMLDGGVRVFEYLPSMLHAKTMVVDGKWGYVGSANVDIRSFRLNFELSAMVVDDAFAVNLERRFLRDLEHSREVTQEMLTGWSGRKKLAQDTARLLSPLL